MSLGASRTSVCRAVPFGTAACLALCLTLLTISVPGAEFLEGFDGPKPTWLILVGSRQCRIVDHRRYQEISHAGTASENVVFEAAQISKAELSHGLSRARVLAEPLTGSVWVRSNRSGAVFSLRLVYPHLTDPETGKIAFRWLKGEAYSEDGKWQNLKCRITKKDLATRNQLLRAQYGANADLHDPYVDRAKLSLDLGVGTTELFIDELSLNPVISPGTDTPLLTEDLPAAPQFPEFKMQHDRLLLDGLARFFTFLPYHGEPPAELANMGVNLVWIPRVDDRQLIDSLYQAGVGVIATPPLAVSPDGSVLDAENAGLAPLTEDLDPILFWMLGNEIPASGRRRLTNWQKQLLSADRRRQRPLMANVSSGERGFSRLVDMLGVNRSVNGTGLNYLRYRDWLADRQVLARPGSFMWTWIDAEASAELVSRRQSLNQVLPVLEPDQLRLQSYAALSSGIRGMGFWTTQGLFHEGAGAAETRLMLKQLHFEVRLLEPWLASGSHGNDAEFRLPAEKPAHIVKTSVRKPKVAAVGHSVPTDSTRPVGETARVSATLFESEFGTLLLGTWFEDHSQFVPGRMASENVEIVVPGMKETAKAWEVTTTGIESLIIDRNAIGGTRIRLPLFDSTTAIVISSDLTLGDDLRQRMQEIQAESATCIVQLARAKLQRVEGVVKELRELGHSQPDDDRMLRKAHELTELGTKLLEKKNYQDARKHGDSALQMLRILQRAHWDEAVRTMSDPVSSPHTVCFQTLPDHWRLQARLQASRRPGTANLLRSGDFEDEDTFRTAGWQHTQNDVPGIVATAELIQPAGRRGYSLRMAAAPLPDKPAPLIVPAPPVTVVTPAVPVQAGQTVRIRGELKVTRPIIGTRDGFHISDSLTGSSTAIHRMQATDWQQFELIREVQSTSSLTVKLDLFGIGEVLVDNLKIEAWDLPSATVPRTAVRQGN